MGRRKTTGAEQAARELELRRRGERIRDLRLRAGFESQMDVVRSGRLDSGTLSNIEAGRKDMYLGTAIELAEAYGVSIDTLAARAPVPPIDEPYPARTPIVMSPEFAAAPDAVRQWFSSLSSDGAESWSTMRWARVLDRGLALAAEGVRLSPASGAVTLALVKPPSTPPSTPPRR